ncbi:MAG: transglycosylase SLT domain-containing protein [Myxococcaceae bacterium]
MERPESIPSVQVSEFPLDGEERHRGRNTVREPLLSRALADVSKSEPDPIRPWAFVSLGLAGVVVVGLVTAATLLGPKLYALNQTLKAQVSESQSWVKETQALKEQTQQLKTEVEALRLYIGSSANEDVIFLKIMILKPRIDQTLARTIARHVHRYSELHGKDPNLTLAIMAVESDFNPKAKSNVGALGLMQVMPQWKKVLGIQGDLDDPETSIRYGLQILGFYTEMYKDLEMSLTAYNRGPGPVDMALMRGKDPKNGYPAHVLETYQRLKGMSVTTPQR